MVTTTRSTDPEKVAEVKAATKERQKKDAVLEKLVEKKRRIEKTARVLLKIEYQDKIDDFLQNKLPFIESFLLDILDISLISLPFALTSTSL